MKLNIKYGRQIGYGVTGILLGAIVYTVLSVDIPTDLYTPSTEPTYEEYAEGLEDDYGLNIPPVPGENPDNSLDEDYTGDVVPLFKFGTYHLTQADFDHYELIEVVKYGKVNPTFYYFRKIVSKETTDNPNGKQKENATQKAVDAVANVANKGTEQTEAPPKTDTVKEISLSKDDMKGDNSGGSLIAEGIDIKAKQVVMADVGPLASILKTEAIMPLDKEHLTISSHYGKRTDPFTNQEAYHAGTDFSTSNIQGANVYAVMSGVVVEAVASLEKTGLGNHIIIDHNGYQSIYGHLKDAPLLKKGDSVKQGDIIGLVGSTGRSTGPHLHLEIALDDLRFDPMLFFTTNGGDE